MQLESSSLVAESCSVNGRNISNGRKHLAACENIGGGGGLSAQWLMYVSMASDNNLSINDQYNENMAAAICNGAISIFSYSKQWPWRRMWLEKKLYHPQCVKASKYYSAIQ